MLFEANFELLNFCTWMNRFILLICQISQLNTIKNSTCVSNCNKIAQQAWKIAQTCLRRPRVFPTMGASDIWYDSPYSKKRWLIRRYLLYHVWTKNKMKSKMKMNTALPAKSDCNGLGSEIILLQGFDISIHLSWSAHFEPCWFHHCHHH